MKIYGLGVLEAKYHIEIAPERLRHAPRILGHGFGVIFECMIVFLGEISIGNLYFPRFENSEGISQYLLINLGLGPLLKCAPGHDSMEDVSIIKSY